MIENLTNKLKCLAVLDAIIEAEWEYRYFSYDSNWSDSEEMGSMRDGCGGEWFLWTSGGLAGYKCVSPEDGLMKNLEEVKLKASKEYEPFISEPAFSMDRATSIWYLKGTKWEKYGKNVDWLIGLDTVSNWGPSEYVSWATDYYEREISLPAVQKLFSNELSERTAKLLNKERDFNELAKEVLAIGFNS